jgi:hypothetical protein
MEKSQKKKTKSGGRRPRFLAIRPPKSFVGSLPPFTVTEKRAAPQRGIGTLLTIQKSCEILSNYGCFARKFATNAESYSVLHVSRGKTRYRKRASRNV